MRSNSRWSPAIATLILLMVSGTFEARLAGQESGEPTKAQLIELLKVVHPLLESGKLEAASAYFMQPPGFEPKMLDGMVERREISMPGILRLERDGTFGTAIQVFGRERAEYFAGRFQVDPASCFGFNYQTDGVAGEVLATWDGSAFKLMRLDDIGKLPGPLSVTESGGKEPPVSAEEKSAMKSDSNDGATGEAQASLSELEEAVASMPEDMTARARYAMALFQLGNLPESWKQLMAANRVQSDHAGITRGMKAVFVEFEKRGVFTVGVPPETVTGLLGSPSQEIPMGPDGNRYVYGFMAVDFLDGQLRRTVDLRGVDKSLFLPTEIVDIELPIGWRCGLRRLQKNSNAALYFPPGESIQQWTEKFEIERIQGVADQPLGEIAKKMLEQIQAYQPEASARVVEEAKDSAIIAVRMPGPNEEESEFRLVRFLKGPTDLHRIEIAVKAESLNSEQKSWMQRLQAASLKPVEKPAKPAG